MRRRDVGEAGAGRAADAGGDVEAVAIDRDRRDARPGSGERRPGAGIAGILEPCRIARIEQHLAHQRQPVLRARDDDDLVRRAGRAADAAHVLGDLLAQREQPGRVGVVELGDRHRLQAPHRQPRPGVHGDAVERRRSEAEGPRRSAEFRRRARGRGQRGAAARQRRMPHAWRCRGRGAPAIDGHRIGDVGAGAGAGADQSFRGELIEGEDGGRARDAQILGQRPRGRQPRAGLQHAVADGAAKAGAQLCLQRLAGPRVEAHQHLGGERAHDRATGLTDGAGDLDLWRATGSAGVPDCGRVRRPRRRTTCRPRPPPR